MTRGSIIACALALAAFAGPAAAEPKLQVLQADGRADAKVRAKIDASIVALARTSGAQVIPGDITFTDAATAVGCTAHDAACRSEVLGMLSVDEIVITTVSPKPGGFEVAVQRVGKGGAAREAVGFVAQDRLDKLDAIAPLFSAKPAPAPPTARPFGPQPAPPPPPAPSPPPAAVTATTSPKPPAELAPSAPPPPAVTAPRTSPIETPPGEPYAAGKDDRPRGSRLPMYGMAGGATMVLVGLIFWGSAASVQGEIDEAPAGTKAQLRALQDLEARGDAYAGAGNLFFVGGLVLGGVSTYYFVKGRRSRATTARLVPAVFEGGGGLAFAIGGMP